MEQSSRPTGRRLKEIVLVDDVDGFGWSGAIYRLCVVLLNKADRLDDVDRPNRSSGSSHGRGGERRHLALGSRLRERLTATGTLTVAALRHQPPGHARIAGLLLSRQRPPTAHGTVFLAIEDETGIANVTIRNSDWPRMRDAVRGASLLLIEGHLERTGDVANLVAQRIAPLTAGRLGRRERIG